MKLPKREADWMSEASPARQPAIGWSKHAEGFSPYLEGVGRFSVPARIRNQLDSL